jgi:hypothetical protein
MKEQVVIEQTAPTATMPEKQENVVCIACREPGRPNTLFQAPCIRYDRDHKYCATCLNSTFLAALKDECLYPPRCCSMALAGPKAFKILPTATVRLFKAKQLEMSTKDKTYCHRAECSTFIPRHSIHNNEAFCSKCRARTCDRCKNAWHFGPCTFEKERDLLETAKREMWQRCPGCRRLVERDEGCNDMV